MRVIDMTLAEQVKPGRSRVRRHRGRAVAAGLMGALALSTVMALSGIAPAANAANAVPTWTQLSPATSPPARYLASMAYDPATSQLVLFGGLSLSEGSLNDTWTWNGTTWAKLSPATGPLARFAASMAYDPATSQLVLFGGQGSSGPLNDTWTWNGTTWTRLSPATRPPAR